MLGKLVACEPTVQKKVPADVILSSVGWAPDYVFKKFYQKTLLLIIVWENINIEKI